MTVEKKKVLIDENVIPVCSRKGYESLVNQGYKGDALIATWVEGEICALLPSEEWDKFVDKSEVWERG